MKRVVLFLCISLFPALCTAGCITSPSNGILPPAAIPGTPHPVDAAPAPGKNITVFYPLYPDAPPIPVLLTGTDWMIAGECGWTADNLSETAALFRDNCQVRNLLGDGWEIAGIGYDMNFLGSRCRKSTHPDAADTCDWCLDSGPTPALRYRGIMTTEFIADTKERKVSQFRTELPEGAGSAFPGDSEIIRYRNGTVLYTFRNC